MFGQFLRVVAKTGPKFDLVVALVTIAGLVILPWQSSLSPITVGAILGGSFLVWWIVKVHIAGMALLAGSRIKLGVKGCISDDDLAQSVWTLEYSELVQQGSLLELVASSSGFHKPLCILRVWKIVPTQQIQAIQIWPTPTATNLSEYVNDESKRNGLYATPSIGLEELEAWGVPIIEKGLTSEGEKTNDN